MEDPYLAGSIAILAALLSFLFSAIREALILYNPPRLKELYADTTKQARLDRYVEDQDLLEFSALSMLGISNGLFMLSLLLYVHLVSGADASIVTSVLTSCAIGLPALYLTNQFVAGPLVRWNSERVVYHGMGLLTPLRFLFAPLFRIQSSLTNATARLSGRDPEEAEEQEIVDEIESVTEEGEREGVIEESGARMIKGILRMQDDQVDQVMIPRIDIASVPVSMPIDEAASFALRQGHSRIPVYRDNMDRVIGVLYVKDFLKYWRREENGQMPTIEQLMRKPTFVPESMRILDLLRDFRRAKNHMAIVLDEYGGTAGLITIEDILEEIVGEIEDEYDAPTEEPLKLLDDGSADVDAKVHIEDINDALKIDLDDTGDYDTIGGFVFSTLGKIPDPGDSFVHGNVKFTVTEAGERRINRVKLTLLPDE